MYINILEIENVSDGLDIQAKPRVQSENNQNDVFCMSCFHQSYTRWKLSHGIIDANTAKQLLNYSSGPIQQQNGELNRRSTVNKTNIDFRPWSWLNESLSDLLDLQLPNVTDWEKGNTVNLQPGLKINETKHNAIENDLATIFKLYEIALAIAAKENNGEDMAQSIKKLLLENLVSNQKQKLKDELSLMINDEYFVIDRPYGLLVYSSGLGHHTSIDKYLAEFYLKTTKEIIEILGLTEKSFIDIKHIPISIKNRLFYPDRLQPYNEP